MYRTYGNLAFQPEETRETRPAVTAAPRTLPRSVPHPVSRPTDRPVVRPVRIGAPAPRRAEPLPAARPMTREDAMRRNIALKRSKRVASTVFGILVVSGILGFMVYRQCIVMEQSYAVAKTVVETSKLNIDTQVVQERISAATDLVAIRTLAIERLGMQDPATRQMINVELPQSDRIVIGGSASSGTLSTTDSNADAGATLLRNAMDNLEGFFRTLH